MSDFKLTSSDFDDCSTIICLSERAREFWNKREYSKCVIVGNSQNNLYVINNYNIRKICNEIRENDMDFTN
tara:strand:+ start:526 stop:738 length:213 start_codon:yes stop_codon:yes gene_type:complete